MRIISGDLKGKKISFSNSIVTRPLKDMVRESIFNIILHSNLIDVTIKNSMVLDLYSGTGSFGIECVSRGAKKVVFVENDKRTLEVLKKNLEKLSIKNKTSLFPLEVKSFLDQFNESNKFDIIFFDPPFTNEKFKNELRLIKQLKIFSKKNLVIIHTEEKKNQNFSNLLKILTTKKYGRSKITFGVF